ncbi:NTP transferase domain-containing protein [Rufibacter roseus]|uniref:NTP transferase domain-containing protein n=1 Tax=Rufibacter roseus TaxID=1567108 RepID=A0ABW2DNM2_9BACT|nr:NTP transferase domain-containing protein [Rufibacter roseus]
MTSKEHKKHTAIARPSYGNYSRQEWAILGTNCGAIKQFADTVISALAPEFACAYVDAQHAIHEEEATLPSRLASGAIAEYTDNINHHQFVINQPLNHFQFRQWFAGADAVLVNGNHHQAKAQVVVLDAAKKASLQKRLPQLTDVQLFLLAEGVEEVFDFVQEAISDWQQIPVFRLSETDKIVAFFQKQLAKATPVLNGLVLVGGKSLRMGHDKGAIAWHQKEQRYFMADLLQKFCSEVFISCRPEQQTDIDSAYHTLPDTFTDVGPYGAILSAFREKPDAAWLVAACDLPLMDHTTLEYLTQHRKVSATATTFVSPHDNFPEPLITIWEPKSYPQLLAFLAQGYTCPRKVLMNTPVQLLSPPRPEALLNVNTPEELEQVKQLLLQKP